MSHGVVQTSVEKRPRSQFGAEGEEGGGRRTEAWRGHPVSPRWMHYLPLGVFYDFLRSHNKVRQRLSHNGPARSFLLPPSLLAARPSFVGPFSFFLRKRSGIVSVHRCRAIPARKYRHRSSFMSIIPRWSLRVAQS